MPRTGALWAGIAAGPAVWFLSHLANFVLAPWACAFRWKPVLYAVSLAALLISGASVLFAGGLWRQLNVEVPGEAAGAMPRARLMAIAGVLLSGISFLTILGQALAEAMLGACD